MFVSKTAKENVRQMYNGTLLAVQLMAMGQVLADAAPIQVKQLAQERQKKYQAIVQVLDMLLLQWIALGDVNYKWQNFMLFYFMRLFKALFLRHCEPIRARQSF